MELEIIKKIPRLIDLENYVLVRTADFDLHFELRPPYCDRGRYKVLVDNRGYLNTIDGDDFFPRFYFLGESLANEILEWLKARKQKDIEDVVIPMNSSMSEEVIKNIILSECKKEDKQ